MMEQNPVLQMHCLCGRADEAVSLASKTLPISTRLCHCNVCRSTSGMLCCAYIEIASKPSLQHLTTYRISEDETRYFCGDCGTHLLSILASGNQYRVASGTLEHNGNVISVIGHERLEDTVDGGLQNFLKIDTGPLEQSADNKETIEETRWSQNGKEFSQGTRKLEGKCHCGGVVFFITPPSQKSMQPTSPWPDLLIPYHSFSAENKQDVKWWLRSGGTKYLAGLCACRSCRLGAGFPIQSWTFVPKTNLEQSDGQLLDFGSGSLKRFESSPKIYREFCSKCGATAFWHCEERPELIDVSVGLLHAKSGVLAMDWLDWHTDRVSFGEESLDRELVGALEVGLKSWQSRSLSLQQAEVGKAQ